MRSRSSTLLILLASVSLFSIPGCDRSQLAPEATEPLASVLRVRDPMERAELLLSFFDRATGADLPEITLAFDEARPYVDDLAGITLALWWTKQDPVSAYNDGLKGAWIEPAVWTSTVLREWTRLAPEAALEVVEQTIEATGGGEAARASVLAFVRGWFDAKRDPAPLIGLIKSLAFGRPQKEALDVVLYRMVELDGLDAAIAFVEGLPDPADRGFKRDAFKRLATVLVEQDPVIAVEFASRHADGVYGEHLLRRVGRRWGNLDGAAAAAWAMSLPDAEEKGAVLLEVFRGWSNQDPSGSAAWIDAQRYASWLEPAIKMSVIGMAQRGQPESALKRVEALPESPFREQLFTTVARIWFRADPEAANIWLAQVGLAPEIEQSIREPQARPRAPAPRRDRMQPRRPPVPEAKLD